MLNKPNNFLYILIHKLISGAGTSFQYSNLFENFLRSCFVHNFFTLRFSSSAVKAKNAPNFVLYHMASTPQKWAGPLSTIMPECHYCMVF
jgi:hypothetical protein